MRHSMGSKNSRYLILGANGFIGSHLVDHIARDVDTANIRAFDRYSTDPQFFAADNIEIIKGDIYNDIDLANALDGVDYVFHSFSATTPFISDKDPFIDINRNLLRSVEIFSACVTAKVKKIGFISSGGAVYGTTSEKKIVDENDSPLPVSPYGINKLAIEHYLEYFHRTHGLEYVIYRLTNPFGPRQAMRNKQGVIPTFLANILDNRDITVFGDGSMSRDYIYIADAIDMICKSFIAGKQRLYNIGRGEQTSINEIIDALKAIVPTDIHVRYEEAPKSFVQRTDVNIERYREEFGTPNFTPLSQGISELYDSMRL